MKMKIDRPLTLDGFEELLEEFEIEFEATWKYLRELEKAKPWIPREGRQEYRAELRQMLDKVKQLFEERQVFAALASALMKRPLESRQLSEQEAQGIVRAAIACTQGKVEPGLWS